MAEPNLVFTVLCQHCGRPLYGRVRFCPYCGKEESITLVAGAATARHALERETAGEGGAQVLAAAPAAAQSTQAQQVAAANAGPGPAVGPSEAQGSDSAKRHFAALPRSQAIEPAPPPVLQAHVSPDGTGRKRPTAGKVTAIALLLLALVLLPVHVDRQGANVPGNAGSLAPAGNRDDRSVTQRAAAAWVATYDAGARRVIAGLDRLIQVRTHRPVQPSGAGPEVARELEPHLVPARPAQESAAPAIVTALPGPEEAKARKETACSPALVALALCSAEQIPDADPQGSKLK